MYCNNCGQHNPEDSKFCKSCGLELIKVSDDHKTTSHTDAKITSSETEDKKSPKDTEKVNAGLGGWLALVGLGLIVGVFIQGYGVLEYLPLLSETYNIPGYLTLIQIEFVASTILTVANVYLLYLYFKKNKNFPSYYIIFLVVSVAYVLLDHLFLASLNAPTQELKKVIDDTLSQNSGDVGRTIITSIIWGAYMNSSKRVKATFINSK